MKILILLLLLIPFQLIAKEVTLVCAGEISNYLQADGFSTKHFNEYIISFDDSKKSASFDGKLTCDKYKDSDVIKDDYFEITKNQINFSRSIENDGVEQCRHKISINRLTGKLDFVIMFGGGLIMDSGIVNCNAQDKAKF